MADVGVPCFVDPGNRDDIWIDWDKAYEEHVPAWEREARVRRVPVILLTLQLQDGRHIVFEHVYGPRHAKHYKPGREIDVWIDPAGAICPGR